MVAINEKRINQIASTARHMIFPNGEMGNDYLISHIKKHLSMTILSTRADIAYGHIQWNSRARKPEIIVSQELPLGLRTFTMAHELGHLMLDWHWKPGTDLTPQASQRFDILDVYHSSAVDTRQLSRDDIKREKGADAFAQRLLIPASYLRKLYQDTGTQDIDYLKYVISHDCHVTADMAYLRLLH